MFKIRKPHGKLFSVRSKRLRLSVKWIGLGLFCLISAAIFWWVVSGRGLSIRLVECRHDGGDCDEQVKAELAKIIGQPTLTFNTEALSRKLTEANPALSKAEVQVRLPGTVVVNLVGKLPFAILKTKNSRSFFLCDEKGYVFAISDFYPGVIPELILGQADFSVGRRLEQPEITASLQLIGSLASQFIPFRRVELVSSSVASVGLADGSEAIFSLEGNLDDQVTSLQQILTQATIDGQPSLIDVRYDKPVISPREKTQ